VGEEPLGLRRVGDARLLGIGVYPIELRAEGMEHRAKLINSRFQNPNHKPEISIPNPAKQPLRILVIPLCP
jgi:hypothetical protein